MPVYRYMSDAFKYCVIYRTGGTCNFTWHRSLAMPQQAAESFCADTRRMGYPALVEVYALSMAVGLPSTYGVGGAPASNYQVIDPEDHIEYEDRQRFMRRMLDEPNEE